MLVVGRLGPWSCMSSRTEVRPCFMHAAWASSRNLSAFAGVRSPSARAYTYVGRSSMVSWYDTRSPSAALPIPSLLQAGPETVLARRDMELSLQRAAKTLGRGCAARAQCLAGFGLVAGLWEPATRRTAVFLLGFSFFSALAICPGFYFRLHYFVLMLPAVSLLAGLAINRLSGLIADQFILLRFIPIVLLGAALAWPILGERKFFFEASSVDASRMIYPESPFVESVRIAEYLREHTTQSDTIAVLGSEPQIYFYSNRHSATGYIYTYGLMEAHRYATQMQKEMIREIEQARPKFLISVVMPDSWLQRSESEKLIFNWATEYTAQNYTVAGFVNMLEPDKTDYYFGSVPQSVPQLGKYVLIYERKS